jgi:cytochrome c553
MKQRAARNLAAWVAASGTALAMAQQPAPSAPAFAPANTTAKGVQSMATACAMCHGTQGRVAGDSAVAALAGRSKDEIVQSMAAFKSGQKPATIMHQIAKGYTDAEVAVIAEYFSSQPR